MARIIIEGLDADVLEGRALRTTAGDAKAANGNYFSQMVTPLGLAIPIYTATAIVGGLPIWNPADSGVIVRLVRFTTNRVSGTAAVNSFNLMARTQMGSNVATAHEITAFAETKPISGRLSEINALAGRGGGAATQVRSSNAGTVTIVAGVAEEAVRGLGGSGVEADATANGISRIDHLFHGSVDVYPGTMVWVAGRLASVALYNSCIEWEEVPV
mgnify:CR=1 FL=1